MVQVSGGGGSVPSGDAGDLVALDGLGGEAAVTRLALRADGRRPALPDFKLLWECNETSGDFINTGSVGTSANLSTIGSGVSRGQLGVTTLGRGARFDGTTNGYARGGAGITPGTGSDTSLTLFVCATVEAAPSRTDLIMRALTTTMAYLPYISVTISVSSATEWFVKIGDSLGYTEIVSSLPYQVGRPHIFGMTYDGSTARLWLDGALARSVSRAGVIDWGDGYGDGQWWLASNPGNEATSALITRAGAANVVWGAAEVGAVDADDMAADE
jgi:hypothetical protein